MQTKNFYYFFAIIFLLCSKQSVLGQPQKRLLNEHANEDLVQADDQIPKTTNVQEPIIESEPVNYIIIVFGENVTYDTGFSNEFRKDISHIKINDSEKSAIEKLEIEANSEIEIHFSKPIESMESFFDIFFDKNAEYIKFVNMSNFNASLVTSFAYMLYQCTSLEGFVLPKTESPLLTNIESMFEGCSNLILIDLTQFNFENVINMDALFYNCSSLVYVNMSSLNLGKVESAEFMIDGAKDLIYLDFKGSNLTDAMLKNLFKDQYPYICLGQTKSEYKEICAEINIVEDKELYFSDWNYIEIYYGIEDKSHQFSSVCEECFKDIGYLKVGNSIISKNEKFAIQPDTEVDIFFINPVKNISNLFSQNENLTEIYINELNTGELVYMEKTFANCTNLEYVYLYNLDSSSLRNMNSLFDSCTSLMSIDLYFNDFGNVENCDDMFKGVNNLAFIINYFTSLSENVINQFPNYTLMYDDYWGQPLKENYLTYDSIYDENAISHIKIKYKEEVVFNINYSLKYIDKISLMKVNWGSFLLKKNPFTILSDQELRMYFFSPLDTLESFFDSRENSNVNKIISVDFSYFNFKGIKSTRNMFYGCSSLKYFDISGADISDITNFNDMFNGCQSLISVNFANVKFNKSEITMNNLFYNCTSLNTLDFSGTSFDCDSNSIFSDKHPLGYLNLKDTSFQTNFLKNFNGVITNVSIICSPNNADDFNSLKIAESKCVDFDAEQSNIIGENYLTVIYQNSFNFSNDSLKANKDIISYIKMNNYRYSIKDNFVIKGKIEIHYSSPPTTFENYFLPGGGGNGLNGQYLISVDFSHLDFSSVTTTKRMFEGCLLLTSVDLSYAKFSSLTNMDNMFLGCGKLKTVILSNIEGRNINSMIATFGYCSSLKILDLSNSNLGNVENNDNIFERVDSLDYLVVRGTSLSDKFKEKLKNILKSNTIVKGAFEDNYQDAIYITKDCEYNFNTGKCELSNYIKVYYKNGTDSRSTFTFTLLSRYKEYIDLI